MLEALKWWFSQACSTTLPWPNQGSRVRESGWGNNYYQNWGVYWRRDRPRQSENGRNCWETHWKRGTWFVLLHCMSSALLQYAGRFRHLFRMFNYFFFCLAHHRQLSELCFCIILSWIKYSKGHSLPSPLFYRLTHVKKVRVELSLMFTFNIIRMVLINGSNYPARMSYGYFINSVFVKCSF